MTDFDRIFDEQYTAVDLFTDRVAENAAFAASLQVHAERLSRHEARLGEQGRDNVLTYYGVGGIGKTELSRRLERWLHGDLPEPNEWGPAPRLPVPARSVRYDFHGAAGVDPIDLVLRLRAAVARPGARFPAFDLGLAAWWSLARPGTALPDLRTHTDFDVKAQIVDTLNELMSEAGARFGVGPLTVRMGMLVVDAIRTRRVSGRVVHECAPLSALVDTARHDPSPYVAATLAGLLSWDLEHGDATGSPLVVAFADAAEYIQDASHTQQRLFNRVVHLSPWVLWVVTTRTSLDWGDPALVGTLPAAGPTVWPSLQLTKQSEPRQHRVGDLSATDVTRYIEAASGSPGTPVLPSEIIERIRHGSHGLPLYLDLSLAVARNAVAAGRLLDSGEFGGPLPQLAVRVFADLEPAERDIARTAALTARFDPRLLAEAAGGTLGDAQRFCTRSLVMADDHQVFPYRLHDAVRAAVADEPAGNPGAWAPSDRAARATAILNVLHQWSQDPAADASCRTAVAQEAAALCAAQDLRAPWLMKALTDLPSMVRTASLLPPPDRATWIGQVSLFFGGWRDRRGRDRSDYLASLVSEDLAPDVHEAARRWLAYNLRDQPGSGEQALAIFRQLLAEQPERELYRFHTGYTLRELARYGELAEHLEKYPLTSHHAQARMRADLAFDCGDLDEAVAGLQVRAEHFRSTGNFRTALEVDCTALLRAAFAGTASLEDCERLSDQADRTGTAVHLRTTLAAKIICLRHKPEATLYLAELNKLTETTAVSRTMRDWAPAIIVGLCHNEPRLIDQVRADWAARQPLWGTGRRIVELLLEFAGHDEFLRPVDLRPWSDPEEARQKWMDTFEKLMRSG